MKNYWKTFRILVVIYLCYLLITLIWALVTLIIFGNKQVPEWMGYLTIYPLILFIIFGGIPFLFNSGKIIAREIKEFINGY